jgi:hypothetical protein
MNADERKNCNGDCNSVEDAAGEISTGGSL